MEKKNIDWGSLGFAYMPTDKRYVSNFKDGAWDEGALIDDPTVTISESAGVLQYAQTVFEGLKAYTTEDGHIVCFRPDLNASRMADSARRLEMPVFPEDPAGAPAACVFSVEEECAGIWLQPSMVPVVINPASTNEAARISRCRCPNLLCCDENSL